jgi:hypothetical protein
VSDRSSFGQGISGKPKKGGRTTPKKAKAVTWPFWLPRNGLYGLVPSRRMATSYVDSLNTPERRAEYADLMASYRQPRGPRGQAPRVLP